MIVAAIALLPTAAPGQSSSAAVLAESIALHDPADAWPAGTFHMAFEESRPDGSIRETAVRIDNERGRFEIDTAREGRSLRGELGPGECVWRLDGSTDVSEAEREQFGLTCPRLERWRNYYVYLWGMPMKLRDPGTRIDPLAEAVDFEGREALEIRVTYDETVGSDIWYFYFDPGDYALIGYRFYHDEAANDGEYIVLDGLAEGAGLRLPMKRAWYTHQEDRYLGTDTVVSIEHR